MGPRAIHIMMPNQWKWLSIFACMNAFEDTIPYFYVFKGK